MLYWTDFSSIRPGIYHSSVVNPVREALNVSSGLFWPFALAIDFSGN